MLGRFWVVANCPAVSVLGHFEGSSCQHQSNHAIKRQSKRKRNAAQAAERSFLVDQLDWAPPAYSDPPIEPIDADGVTAIHNASMRVLEDIGILFLNDAALDVFTKQE